VKYKLCPGVFGGFSYSLHTATSDVQNCYIVFNHLRLVLTSYTARFNIRMLESWFMCPI
jgi:hypothetical protein